MQDGGESGQAGTLLNPQKCLSPSKVKPPHSHQGPPTPAAFLHVSSLQKPTKGEKARCYGQPLPPCMTTGPQSYYMLMRLSGRAITC